MTKESPRSCSILPVPSFPGTRILDDVRKLARRPASAHPAFRSFSLTEAFSIVYTEAGQLVQALWCGLTPARKPLGKIVCSW